MFVISPTIVGLGELSPRGKLCFVFLHWTEVLELRKQHVESIELIWQDKMSLSATLSNLPSQTLEKKSSLEDFSFCQEMKNGGDALETSESDNCALSGFLRALKLRLVWTQ